MKDVGDETGVTQRKPGDWIRVMEVRIDHTAQRNAHFLIHFLVQHRRVAFVCVVIDNYKGLVLFNSIPHFLVAMEWNHIKLVLLNYVISQTESTHNKAHLLHRHVLIKLALTALLSIAHA